MNIHYTRGAPPAEKIDIANRVEQIEHSPQFAMLTQLKSARPFMQNELIVFLEIG